jgi:hypothetical protein
MPHSTDSTYVDHARWDQERKRNARYNSIIRTYKKFWQRSSIPDDRQYWTMCGAHYNEEEGKLQGELGHILEHDLIHPEQFFGIDYNSAIIKKNKFYYPHINWIFGDFIRTIEKSIRENNFNPAIINYDGVMMPKYASKYLKKLFKLIDYNISKSVLLSTTFVLQNSYNPTIRNDPQDCMKFIKKEYWIADHWLPLKKMIPYNTSKHTDMIVIVWLKCEHDPDNIKTTSHRNFEDWFNEESIIS